MILNDPRFIRNSFFNIVGQVFPLLIGLATIPTLIHQLGMDRFGLLSLIWVFLGYMTFLDLGLSRAVIKMISEDLATNRRDDIAPTLWTANWVVFALSLLGTVLIAFSSEALIQNVLHIPVDLHDEAADALRWIGWSLPLLTLTSVFRGSLEAQHRFLSANVLQGVSSSVNYLVPFIMLPFSHSIEDIIIAVTGGRFLSLVAHVWVSNRAIPGLGFPRAPSRSHLRRLVDFGSWLTVSNLISPLMVYFDRFVLGTYLPVGTLAYYTTPYEIVSRVTILPSAISRVLFPTFSAVSAREDARSSNLLVKSLDILGFLFLPICALLILLAPVGLKVWLGGDFAEKSAPILQIFALGIFFNGLASIPYTFLQGANRPDLTAKAHLVELPFYALLLWSLTTELGIVGAAAAWSLRMIFDFAILLYFSLRATGRMPMAARGLLPLSFVMMAIFALAISHVSLAISGTFFVLSLFYLWGRVLTTEDRLRILAQTLPSSEDPKTHLNQIAAVIVTHNPTEDVASNWEAIRGQFDDVLIVDNGSNPDSKKVLKQLESQGARILYNTDNRGIAAALNQGFEWAEKQGAGWVASFDQDSCPPSHFRARLRDALVAGDGDGRVGLIGPALQEMSIRRRIVRESEDSNDLLTEVPTVITSGSLCRVSVFREVGGFDDRLFIDYVDHDFSLKIRRHGHRVVEYPQVTLEHHLGRSKQHSLLFTSFFSTHHSALRRYYNTRNRFRVYARYFWIEPAWVAHDFTLFIKEVTKIILVEKDKMRKIGNIVRGLWDSLRGRLGRTEAGEIQ